MKKFLFLFFVLLNILPCFATELWNGFTDEMTKNQVIARANKLFPKSNSYDTTVHYKNFDEFYQFYRPFSNDNFPYSDSVIGYFVYTNEFSNNGNNGNIKFFFYDNHLTGIVITWNEELGDAILQKAKENYGNNFKTKTEDFSTNMLWGQYITNRYTIWENDNTDICLYEENITHKYTDAVVIEMLALSKTRLLEKRNRVQAENQQKKKELENQRKKTIDNLIF